MARGQDLPAVAEGSLFARFCHFDTLYAAWGKVAANRGACGGDGVTIGAFGRNAGVQVARLSAALADGSYFPGPARRVMIPKRSGGLRPLDIPCVIDRVAQTAMAGLLTPIFEPIFNDASYAYRRGRSVAQAVARVASLRRAGFVWALDADVERYFENIPHDRLMPKVAALVPDAQLADMVHFWLDHYAPEGRGLPQGSPLSPLLANLHLDALDDAFEGGRLRLVRFADDFVVLAKSEALALAALAEVTDRLADEGLVLNQGKTRVVRFEDALRFLGHVFVRGTVLAERREDPAPSEEEMAELTADEPPAEDEPEPEPAAPGRFARRLRPLYILEPGRRLDARGEHFLVREGEAVLLELPQRMVDLISVSTETEIAAAALALAASSETEIVTVGAGGETLGRWSSPSPGPARRQLAQARHALDPARALPLISEFVAARLYNQRCLLRRLNRSRKLVALGEAATRIHRIERKLLRPSLGLDGLRGHEGEAGALYWPALWRVAGPEISWQNRRQRPAQDPLNLVINVLCGLLERDVRIALVRAGLHPGFGFLHAAQDRADALVFDLMEPFRGPLTEALGLALFSRKALRAEWFLPQGRGIRLDRQGWRAIIRGYETQLSRQIEDPASGSQMLWRGLIAEQAEALAQHIEGGAPFRAYRMDF